MLNKKQFIVISIIFSFFLFPFSVLAGNCTGYAWGENIGWLNFNPADGGGVTVADAGVTGYVWAENIGWIKLDYDEEPGALNTSATNWGITNDGSGNLAGYAWGENIGWINFYPTPDSRVIITGGNFSGFAWAENIGWIKFNHSQTSEPATTWSPAGGNTAPAATSVSASPQAVNVGSDITFTGNWTEANSGDLDKMYICKDSACTNCDNTAQSNCWCYSSLDQTEPDTTDTCTHTAQTADIGNRNYWLKVCDDEPSCSSSLFGKSFTVGLNSGAKLILMGTATKILKMVGTVLYKLIMKFQ